MTLDELIEQAQAFRAHGTPGDAPVLVMTATGSMPAVALGESRAFSDRAGTHAIAVIVVLAGVRAPQSTHMQ